MSIVAWRVEILDHRAVKELDALAQDVRQRFLRIAEPMKGKDGIARAIYVTAQGERVVILHAFVKKTQETPRSALEIARKRAKEVT
jgi:hypothetical protein